MSIFNMGAVKGARVATPTAYLRAGIHNVIFKGISKIDGMDSMELRFEAVDGSGVHNERIFAPRTDERSVGQYGENPSEAEQFMCKVKQVIDALDPKLSKQIDEKGDAFNAPDFTSFVNLLKAYLDKAVGTTTQIKLLPTTGNFVGFPGFPARINRDGNLYMTTLFIGNNLTLTPKEATLVSTVKTAKPTEMKSELADLADEVDDLPMTPKEDDFPF